MLRAIDKLPKIGEDAVLAEMVEKVGTTADQARTVLRTVGPESNLDFLESTFAGNPSVALGVERLRQLFSATEAVGIPKERVQLDVSIARGLDYYTGTIYETFLSDLPNIGSICSGGRYDNLAGLFTKEKLPGVGASLGLDRLIGAMEVLKLLGNEATPAPVLMTQFDAGRLTDYLRVARMLRAASIGTEVYPEAKKLGKQLQYADRKGFKFALIAGSDEFAKGVWQIKNLKQGSTETVPESELIPSLQRELNRA